MIPAHGTQYVRRAVSRLVIERMARRMNQREVAQGAGIRQCSISNIESGKVPNPGLGTVAAIAEQVGMRVVLVPDYLEPLARLDRAEMNWIEGRVAQEIGDGSQSPVLRSLARKLGGWE